MTAPGLTAAHIVDQQIVRFEYHEFRREFRAHRRQCPPAVHAQSSHSWAAILDILVDVRAVRAGDEQKDVLRGDARSQRTGKVVADRFADAEPGLAHGDGIQHVRPANPARGTVERARRAGVRVAVDQHRAGNGIAAIGDHGMRDALIQPDVMQPLDAEPRREPAAGGVRGRRPGRWARAPDGRTR